MGQYNVVALNRGTAAGLEPGHVLAVFQTRRRRARHLLEGRSGRCQADVQYRRRPKVQLPEERVGVIMVFKAFDRMSYALVMESTHEIRQGDRARNP